MHTNTVFWPQNYAGAVSLTFDDALETQLENAIPLLDRTQLAATFYVNPGRSDLWESQLPQWQQAVQSGHEIGNHTEGHPCSCNFGFDDCFCLEKLGLDDIAETIDQAEQALDMLFPSQKNKRSFCYPCYQSYVGAGKTRQSYVPLVAERFRGARGGGERANDPLKIDLAYIWALDVQGKSGAQMIHFVEQAVAQGQWAVLCMHGVGGQHLAIGTDALAELIDFLYSKRTTIWTDTLISVTDYILKRRTELAST